MIFRTQTRSGARTCLAGASASDDLFGHPEVSSSSSRRQQSTEGYTLVEVMIVMGLIVMLMVGAAGAVSSGNLISRRLSDYTAAMAVVEAKVEDIRAATYSPPTSPFTSSVVTLTNASSIALNQAGTAFVVSGTVTSRIEPVTSGHLVTVTGTFQTRRKPITVTLQTVVNKYSAGQQ